MKVSELKQAFRQALLEANVTSGGASFTAGEGENYATPKAFGKKKRKKRKKDGTGFTRVERPVRPSSTKLIDYL